MSRFSIRSLDVPAGTPDGQVPAVSGSRLVYSAPATGAVPAGGTAGQVLAKLSAADYDVGWQTPSSSGGGATPTIVGQTLTPVVNASSIAAPIPSQAQAGDTLVLIAGHGYAVTPPANWTLFDKSDGTQLEGLTAGKQATASDVGGTVTVTFGGSYYGEVMIVAVRGATTYDGTQTARSSGTTALSAGNSGKSGDLLIAGAVCRATNALLTCDRGALIANRSADSNSACALYSKTDDTSDFLANFNWTSTVSGGMYVSTVALGG